MKQVLDLIEASNRSVIKQANAWCDSDNQIIKAYLRVQRRYLEGKSCHCLVLATVVVSPSHRGEGHLSKWLTELERVSVSFDALFVENVMNSVLQECVKRRGYEEYRDPGDEGSAPCYYKLQRKRE